MVKPSPKGYRRDMELRTEKGYKVRWPSGLRRQTKACNMRVHLVRKGVGSNPTLIKAFCGYHSEMQPSLAGCFLLCIICYLLSDFFLILKPLSCLCDYALVEQSNGFTSLPNSYNPSNWFIQVVPLVHQNNIIIRHDWPQVYSF